MIYVVHWPVIMLLLVMGSADPIAFVVPQIIQAGEHFANVLMNFLPLSNLTIGQGVNQIFHCLAATRDGKKIKSL